MAELICPRGFQSHLMCNCKPIRPMPPRKVWEVAARAIQERRQLQTPPPPLARNASPLMQGEGCCLARFATRPVMSSLGRASFAVAWWR